ncbi:MAG: ATP synthase F0 subunit A [Myxococcales bacterium]|nr:ATP synthase F0 subunit A [Myxococcales bacterium]
MPEHVSLLHYLLYFLGANAHVVGTSIEGHHVGYRELEPLVMAGVLMLVLLYLGSEVRGVYRRLKSATIPEEELTLRTFFEVFFEFFYNMARDVMGPKNAKRYFPLIGSCAIFIFVSNAIGLIPGFAPPTSNLNVTAGCALLVFLSFNYYGLKENGLDYVKHLAGWGVFHSFLPNLLLAVLMFPIEVISMCVRPVTLAIRLMLNIAVDHLLVSIFMGLFAILLPLPLMVLGVIVICVQALVFTLLSSIYIGLATAHAEHH